MTPAHTSRRRLRRALVGLVALTTVALDISLTSTASQADTSSQLTVVGTSDVYDSNLIQAVIQPGFLKYDPNITQFAYLSQGTGAAIATAEAGAASALIVHAPSLENQFVAAGYSNEQYGRAIFYGDYVLLGDANDPAKVGTKGLHNIVQAYESVAAAGAAGKANFVSRGGTPGTTVQEHQIWALTTGVTTCTVSAASGGGASPSTVTGPCPTPIPYPSWYHATGLTQGPNILNGDACTYPGGGCYVFTDRGTYVYLQSQGEIQNLVIVTRDNSAAAPGGSNELVNTFHAYAVNPAAFAGNPNVQLNTAGAEAFLNYLQSPAAQQAITNYLSSSDPPFIGDAAPTLTGTQSTSSVKPGTAIVVKGKLTNTDPGTPVLSGETVSLQQTLQGVGTTSIVASTNTTSTGAYTIRYKPTANASYAVVTNQIAKIENATLNPVFGDLLAPATTSVGSVTVQSSVTINSVKASKGVVTIKGTVKPAPNGGTSTLLLYANKTSLVGTQGLILQGSQAATQGATSFTYTTTLTRGFNWTVAIGYQDPNQFLTSQSASKTVQVN